MNLSRVLWAVLLYYRESCEFAGASLLEKAIFYQLPMGTQENISKQIRNIDVSPV
jgi:hypothetical protein